MSAGPAAPSARCASRTPRRTATRSSPATWAHTRQRPPSIPTSATIQRRIFESIGLIAEQPELLAVRADFPANNLKEFLAYAKANESKLNMGHAGVGSVSYIGCLLLNSTIGIK